MGIGFAATVTGVSETASTAGAKGMLIAVSATGLSGIATPSDSKASSGEVSSVAGAISSKGNMGRGGSCSAFSAAFRSVSFGE